MLFKLVLALLICSPLTRVFSQYYFYNDDYYDRPVLIDFSLGAGAVNCLTDLGGSSGSRRGFIRDVQLPMSKPGWMAAFTVDLHRMIAFRLEYFNGMVEATDRRIGDGSAQNLDRATRNLSFQSKIREYSLATELFPLALLGNGSPMLSPYLFGGIGLFHFNPFTEFEGSRVFLQPLRTEGQGMREYPDRPIYRLTQLNLPLGVGVRFEPAPLFVLRLEFNYRILFTDYLDDVSTRYVDPAIFIRYFDPATAARAAALSDRRRTSLTRTEGGIRGNPEKNDSYFSLNLKAGIILNRKKIK